MTEELNGQVELGVFDLARVPCDWNKFSHHDIEQMKRRLDASRDQQVKQLKNRKINIRRKIKKNGSTDSVPSD